MSTVSDSSIIAAVWETVTFEVPLIDPAVALIVAFPFAIEVARPEDETVAIEGSDVVHVTLAPAITVPFWACTVTDISEVCPKASKLKFLGDIVIAVGMGFAGGLGPIGSRDESPLHELSSKLIRSKMDAETCDL